MHEKRTRAEIEKELSRARLLLSQLLPSEFSSPLGSVSMALAGIFFVSMPDESKFDYFDTKQIDRRMKLRAQIASLEQELLELVGVDQFRASSGCKK